MPDIMGAVPVPAGVSLSDCFLFVFHEALSVNIYRTTVGDIQSPVVDYVDAEVLSHSEGYGNGGHIPVSGLNHSDLVLPGVYSHETIDSHLIDNEAHGFRSLFYLSLQNSWVDVNDAPEASAIKRHDQVTLRGVLTGGITTDGTIVATIPEGLWPLYPHIYPGIGGGYLYVGTAGGVKLYGYTSGAVSLCGIVYEVEL